MYLVDIFIDRSKISFTLSIGRNLSLNNTFFPLEMAIYQCDFYFRFVMFINMYCGILN